MTDVRVLSNVHVNTLNDIRPMHDLKTNLIVIICAKRCQRPNIQNAIIIAKTIFSMLSSRVGIVTRSCKL
jgi:hypothetical protein